MVGGRSDDFDSVGSQSDDFARTEVSDGFKVKIGEGCGFGGGSPCPFLFSEDDGRSAPFVACGDDSVLREEKHGAGAVDVAEDVLNPLAEGFSLNQKQCDEFRLIDFSRGEFGEVAVFVQELSHQFLNVVHLRHGDDGKAPQVGVQDKGLCVRVADDSDAGGCSGEAVQTRFKFGAEIGVLQIVDGAREVFVLGIVGSQTASSRAEVRIVVCAIEQVGNALFLRNRSEKASHGNEMIMW